MLERRHLLAYALLVLNMSIWGGHAVVGRAIADTIPPMSINFWRWALAGLVLLPFAWPHLRREWPMVRGHLGILALASLTAVVAFTALFYVGVHYTTSINAALIMMAMPVFVVLLTWVSRLEFITPRQSFGLILSLAGVVIIVIRGDLGVLLALQPNPGDLLILGSATSWGIYSLLLRKLPPDFHYLTLMAAIVLLGLPVLTALYAWEYARLGGFALNAANLATIAFVVLGPAIISFFCWMQAVRVVGANRAAFTNCLVPVFAAIFASIFLDETLEPYHFAGFAVIGAGMYLAILGRDHPATLRAQPTLD